jgi:hypothetical protein
VSTNTYRPAHVDSVLRSALARVTVSARPPCNGSRVTVSARLKCNGSRVTVSARPPCNGSRVTVSAHLYTEALVPQLVVQAGPRQREGPDVPALALISQYTPTITPPLNSGPGQREGPDVPAYKVNTRIIGMHLLIR